MANKKALTCTLHSERIGQYFSLQCPASRCKLVHNTRMGLCQSGSGARTNWRQTSGWALDTTSDPAAKTVLACSGVLMNPVPHTGAFVLFRMVGITWGI